MKRILGLFFVFVLIVSVVTYWIFVNVQPVSSENKLVDFNVQPGMSGTEIGNSLYGKGLIRNPKTFKLYVQFSGISDRIQAGVYRLSSGYTLFQIVDALTSAPATVKVTIPEGFTNEQISARLVSNMAQSDEFKTEFLRLAKDKEGYLFPDTYQFPKDATPAAIIARMVDNFNVKTKSMKIDKNTVILASIIEGETKEGSEREIVSGILLKRLNAGMALQVDVAPETYKSTGLPNSPLNNPGITALEAALNPKDSEYWYYLHDPTGTIHYARTLTEQDANIRKFLR
jgi:UPF0755 protein